MPGLNRLRPGGVSHSTAPVREDDKASPGSPYQHSYLGSSAHSSLRSTPPTLPSWSSSSLAPRPTSKMATPAGLDQLDSAPIEALAKVAALQVAQQEELEAQLAEEKGSQSQRRRVLLAARPQAIEPTNTGSSRQSVNPTRDA